MGHSYVGPERRKYARFSKSYSLFFHIKGVPTAKLDETFTKDINRGGVRFTTSHSIKPGTLLIFEIGISYIAPKKLILEGVVVACTELTPRMIYEIRAKFGSMNAETQQLFNMIEGRK